MFKWVTPDTRTFMSRGYLEEGETVEDRALAIADAFRKRLPVSHQELAAKFYLYLGAGFYSLSSPIWSNFGRKRGLPISCNNSFIPDNVAGMKYKDGEIAIMTQLGAGTSAYLGAVRPRGTPISGGGYADGVSLPALMINSTIDVISQGNVRRGNAALYLDADHGDIDEFLQFREEGSPIQSVSLGVNVSDAFMKSMIAGDADARRIWLRIIRKRFESGYPYIVFSDTVNRNAPDVYRDKGLRINGSNLCAEIALASTEAESFVCNLSSMNIAKYDEWVATDAVEVLAWFLDCVMSEYIDKTEGLQFMEAPRLFAINQRALGMGTLGYHTFLQQNLIPFESVLARAMNIRIHRTIAERALAASKDMAGVLGEPELLKGYGRRNVTLMAIAPTTSSSFILGQVSPSIEPLASNYFTKNLAKGKFTYRNPELRMVLDELGQDTDEVWESILDHGGSVQHLPFLRREDKQVFKTFSEISPSEVIKQAADRQEFVDQSQSVNLMIHPETPLKEVNQLMISAWEQGVKSLYYQRGTNPAQEAVKNINACPVCEG